MDVCTLVFVGEGVGRKEDQGVWMLGWVRGWVRGVLFQPHTVNNESDSQYVNNFCLIDGSPIQNYYESFVSEGQYFN